MHTLALPNINLHSEFQVPSFTHSKDMTGASKFKNWWRDLDHAPPGVAWHL